MAKAVFRLAAENDPYSPITVSVEIAGTNPTDEWWQNLQQHIAANLPEDIAWESVRRYSLQIEASREVDPLPAPEG